MGMKNSTKTVTTTAAVSLITLGLGLAVGWRLGMMSGFILMFALYFAYINVQMLRTKEAREYVLGVTSRVLNQGRVTMCRDQRLHVPALRHKAPDQLIDQHLITSKLGVVAAKPGERAGARHTGQIARTPRPSSQNPGGPMVPSDFWPKEGLIWGQEVDEQGVGVCHQVFLGDRR